jgi:hypothetical protein
MPCAKVADLLLEIEQWTGFTRDFTHLKSNAETADQILLLIAILTVAFNVGSEKIADARPGKRVAICLRWLPGTFGARPIREAWSTSSAIRANCLSIPIGMTALSGGSINQKGIERELTTRCVWRHQSRRERQRAL